MTGKREFHVNRRRMMKLASAAGLVTSSAGPAAGRDERGDPESETDPDDSVAYEDLSPEAQRHFDTALEEGRHTLRAAEAPADLEGVHYVTYEGDTYDVFSHAMWTKLYHLNPNALPDADVRDEEVTDVEELSTAAREAFETAVAEGGFEGEGRLPDDFRTTDRVAFDGAVFRVRSVEGTAKESVMIPRVV